MREHSLYSKQSVLAEKLQRISMVVFSYSTRIHSKMSVKWEICHNFYTFTLLYSLFAWIDGGREIVYPFFLLVFV